MEPKACVKHDARVCPLPQHENLVTCLHTAVVHKRKTSKQLSFHTFWEEIKNSDILSTMVVYEKIFRSMNK